MARKRSKPGAGKKTRVTHRTKHTITYGDQYAATQAAYRRRHKRKKAATGGIAGILGG